MRPVEQTPTEPSDYAALSLTYGSLPAAGALGQRHVEPGLFGLPYAFCVGRQRGAADVGISGSEATESRPTSWPPAVTTSLAALALETREVAAGVERRMPWVVRSRSAERTGARSAAVISLSHPQPIEKLHIAPGNCRSASSSICADLLVRRRRPPRSDGR